MSAIVKNIFSIGDMVQIKLRPLPPLFVIAVSIDLNNDHVYALADNPQNPELIVTDIPQSELQVYEPPKKNQALNSLEYERGFIQANGNLVDFINHMHDKGEGCDGTRIILDYVKEEFRRTLMRIQIVSAEKTKAKT